VELKNPSVAEQVFWRLQQVTCAVLGSRHKAEKLLKHLGAEAEMAASLKDNVASALARRAQRSAAQQISSQHTATHRSVI
jgi:hypothetical protein